MHVNYINSIVRQYGSAFPDDVEAPVGVVLFRSYPVDDAIDPEAVTQGVRRWLLDDRHAPFLFEERRQYADVGAEGSSVEFVLNMLGAGAAEFALE